MYAKFSPWIALVSLATQLGAAAPHPPALAPASPPPIRVDVNLALVPVTVQDSMGRNVMGLERENFRVLDDSKPRPIVAFSRQDAPVTVGLVFDCSRSMADKFAVSRKAPGALFAQLNPEDESFLITVSDRAELRQGPTYDFPTIQNALVFTYPNGSTSLLDGVYMGLQQLRHVHNPRKALVVISDGGDNNSRYNMHELASLAVESDAQIFPICISFHPRTGEEVEGPQLLEKLASLTGGLCFMMPNAGRMSDAMSRIGLDLHNQYVLGIVPPPGAAQGKVRRVKVELVMPVGTPRLSIIARSHYVTP